MNKKKHTKPRHSFYTFSHSFYSIDHPHSEQYSVPFHKLLFSDSEGMKDPQKMGTLIALNILVKRIVDVNAL